MQRKVIQIANSTQLVSLPRKWAVRNNIKKGDVIEIEERENSLVLSPEDVQKPTKRTTIDLNKIEGSKQDFIRSFLPLLHKCGYDEIEVLFDNPSIMKEIQERSKSMLSGYEIIEQSSERCLIKSVSKALESEFDALLRRTFLVTLSMSRGTLENIKEEKFKNLEEQLVLEETNNKLTNLCQRILNTSTYEEGKTSFIYIVTWLLECVGDSYRDICIHLMDQKNIKMSKKLIDLFVQVNELFESYYDMFYKYSFTKFVAIKKKRKEINMGLYDLLTSTKNKPEIKVIMALITITQRIDDFLGSTNGLYY